MRTRRPPFADTKATSRRTADLPLICLATNCLDQPDPAVVDRVRHVIPFALPDPGSCTQWWSRNVLAAWARRRLKLVALGWLRSHRGAFVPRNGRHLLHIVGLGAAEGQSPHVERLYVMGYRYYLVRCMWLFLATRYGHQFFEVFEWVCKTEYQGRGTPHWHIAAWVVCYGILARLAGRTGTSVVSVFLTFLAAVFQCEIDLQGGNDRLNYINGHVSKDN